MCSLLLSFSYCRDLPQILYFSSRRNFTILKFGDPCVEKNRAIKLSMYAPCVYGMYSGIAWFFGIGGLIGISMILSFGKWKMNSHLADLKKPDKAVSTTVIRVHPEKKK